MTRKIVYVGGLVVTLAAFAMTLASIIIPRWISFYSESFSGEPIRYSYGLHKSCSTLTGSCAHFPQYEDCHGSDRHFCSMWKSVGFLMSFAIVIEGMIIIAHLVVLAGGVQKRIHGWKVLSVSLFIAGAIQCAAMAIVAFLYDNDDRFYLWQLDNSWILCTVSWSALIVSATSLIASAYFLPPEGDYELIPERQ
ncbi:hypothetical protein L228DRAFT_251609 [Xylona heveae TC161]|uniref:Pre-mRNA splicing factor n=1 Tax=Xylona heveae (strain CBS 132557 / TC161) TaxID=1328760 RepID=A0A164ZFS7_XYLHT|nr:hypothetical protein L228DRAFT_251609 [Xylona heveae TC161]KZF19047.1 hypothetical protein L228DRAFT_251609 [Xylona heveae TC161]